MIDTVIQAINQINQFEEKKESLSRKHSELDNKIQDLLHYIEFNKFNASQGYMLTKKLQELRNKRRIVTDELLLIGVFEQHSNKLTQIDNRKMLIATLAKNKKGLDNRKYSYDYLTENEINKLIGKNT